MTTFYRKKPIQVEAYRWFGDIHNLPEWLKKHPMLKGVNASGQLIIQTLEGKLNAQQGDWVIKGIAGEIYPCADAIFQQTYDVL